MRIQTVTGLRSNGRHFIVRKSNFLRDNISTIYTSYLVLRQTDVLKICQLVAGLISNSKIYTTMVTNNFPDESIFVAHEYVASPNEHDSVLMRVSMLALFLRYLYIRIFSADTCKFWACQRHSDS